MTQTKDETLVTEKQAAKLTGLHKYELQQLARTGLLKRFGPSRGSGHYIRAQVLQHVKKGGAHLTAGQMGHALRTLEEEVRVIGRGLRTLAQAAGCPHVTFTPTDEELAALYALALKNQERFTAHNPPPAGFVNRWFSVVSRLNVQDFRRINRLHPEDEHPWRPIWLLTEQMKYAHAHQDLRLYDHERSILHNRLSVCLDAMKESVLLFCAIADPRRDPRRTMGRILVSLGQAVAQVEIESLAGSEPMPNPADAIRELAEL